ncbi:MAG: hypothetical protein J0L92_03365 [Deltaproteobacteria bacterium]|nr:hypothetical protein [Deltaproteobacteria bacterium]
MRHPRALAPLLITAVLALPSLSCDTTVDVTPPEPLVHAFPAVSLAPGDEILSECQSWTLDNDEPLYVNAVHMSAGPGWHHSNWTFVPETLFVGPDGTWPCAERSFTELAASLGGGGVFFAQSTQATEEHQVFSEGTVYVIPARSRVIGSIHLLNTTGAPLDTAIRFDVVPIARGQISTVLQPLAIDNRGISIGPRSTTQVTTECDFDRATTGVFAPEVFYVLPHYHGLADGMRIEVFGGERDGELVFETSGGIGNALGGPIDPPVSLAGAQGLRVHCTYTNTGSDTIGWGADASDEMCTMLAYVTGPNILGGAADSIDETTTLPDGTIEQRSRCVAIGARGRQP